MISSLFIKVLSISKSSQDTTDWKHSTTRNVVMQADPELSRTVLVTTKV
jgi:hypothetical protein